MSVVTTPLTFEGTDGGAGDDVGLYKGMAMGAVDFAGHAASMDIVATSGLWQVRNVVLGIDGLVMSAPCRARAALSFKLADASTRSFCSFRQAAGAGACAPHETDEQRPEWWPENPDSSSIVCSLLGPTGETPTAGIMWFRFEYRTLRPVARGGA